ncbi:MAG: RNA pseudouridine synthase, partial [Methanomicrobia archaeon]|nr:RNA pseudouridine synthase [Methanomicrobia archaeon]
HFHVQQRFANATLVECRLETGRTHQIRAHFEYIRHPVVGDPLYGKKHDAIHQGGQLLHAKELSLVHPTTGKVMTFTCPVPSYFEEVLKNL